MQQQFPCKVTGTKDRLCRKEGKDQRLTEYFEDKTGKYEDQIVFQIGRVMGEYRVCKPAEDHRDIGIEKKHHKVIENMCSKERCAL